MRKTIILLACASTLAGCSFMEGKKIDYKSAGTVPSLEVPPDLILPRGDARFVVPESRGGAATFSAYSQERSGQRASSASAILPTVEKVRLERAGSQRWLVVQASPQEVWPVVKDFWQELGFIVNVEIPEAGVLETDWAENRAKIPQDGIRRLLGRVIDQVYSTAERDKFRTRLELSADGKGTEIYISHRGMYEVFEGTQAGGDQGQGRTVWQPRPADPELEAEMLRRLMVRFGVEETRAKAQLAERAAPPQASKTQVDGAPALLLPESFDRAWRRVGLALDRVGFAVEDRDRAGGIYFVRYIDADAATAKEKQGLLSKLAFWRSDEVKSSERYRVKVQAAGDSTQVTVLQDNGAPARVDTANRIVNLLFDQLK